MTVTSLFVPILKSEPNEDGSLAVYGKATGPDLDSTLQVCDPAWLAKAMPRWFETGANVREMHQPIAAGVGTELDQSGDSWMLKADVVDEGSKTKVTKGVLKGYSIGIRNAKIVKGRGEPAGGRIVDGEIVEVSLCDRPVNETCKLTLAKAVGVGDSLDVPDGKTIDDVYDADRHLLKAEALTETEPDRALIGTQPIRTMTEDELREVEKADYSDAERKEMADSGQALPGGGFPIKNAADLRNAIQSVGRAKDPAAAKAHIKKRAASLNREDLIPDSWKAAEADLAKAEEWVHDPAELAGVRDGLARLMQAELDELMKGEDETCDLAELLCSLQMFLCWWDSEADEGEDPEPFTDGDEPEEQAVEMSTIAELVKAAQADDAPDTDKAALADLVKVLTPAMTDAVLSAAEALTADKLEKATEAFETRLATVEKMAAPSGPVKARTEAQQAQATQRDILKAQAQEYRDKAATVVNDRELADGYRELAAQAEAQLATLASS